MRLKPFFTYYGGKWRTAKHYPVPKFDTVVEPFAGSAGYGMLYHEKQVILADIDPVICDVWNYLIAAPENEIAGLPDLAPGQTVDDLAVPEPARHLIGFWLNKGVSSPRRTPSAWMRSGIRPDSFWGPAIRARIAAQLRFIRHWAVFNVPYWAIPDHEATWFVDPPYEAAGKHYRHSKIDYPHLASWVASRSGQSIVCEAEGATWLPFKSLGSFKSNESSRGKGKSFEVLYVIEGE